jgi:2-isopropylmalate synthase
METVTVYDTTLRDGTQREGISLSVEDKLRIVELLDALGVAYIEGGWPGSNPKDAEFFRRAQELQLAHARIAAFGMTCRAGGSPSDDANVRALLHARTPVVTVVGKTSMLHVREVLRTTPEENLRIIRESLRYLKGHEREVIYDAEHFFDGYKLDPDYAIATLRAAVDGGADMVVLCDTNGGSMFWEVDEATGRVAAELPGAVLGIHAHDDGESAVANSLAAVRRGARSVQGTINGYGERCGNANLCSVIPDLELKMGMRCLPEGSLSRLTLVSRAVAEIANLAPDGHQAFVGKSAFAHKGGIHIAAMLRTVQSYQHVDPALVGNQMRFLVSDLSGRGNVLHQAEKLGLNLSSERAQRVLDEIKQLEHEGFVFEGAEASVQLMMHRAAEGYVPPFELLDFVVMVARHKGRGLLTEATVKLKVGGEVRHEVADGNGPVHALDVALRKALTPVYPKLAEFHLVDYKVRIVDSGKGTAATTRVLIDTQDGHERWSTVGAGHNIIDASWRALVDSVEYGVFYAKAGA